MFREVKYILFFLLVIGSVIYLHNFYQNKDWYEYLSYTEISSYDPWDYVDWESMNMDEIDWDLLEEIGVESYFGQIPEADIASPAAASEEMPSTNNPFLIGSFVCLGMFGLYQIKNALE